MLPARAKLDSHVDVAHSKADLLSLSGGIKPTSEQIPEADCPPMAIIATDYCAPFLEYFPPDEMYQVGNPEVCRR